MAADRADRFVSLPLGIGGRWYLPSTPPTAARNALLLAAPYRPAAFAAWAGVRAAATLGGLRLLPEERLPDLEHADLLAAYVPAGGHVAVRPATARGRWTALVLTADGQPHVLVKAAFTDTGRAALQHEAAAQRLVQGRLPDLLSTPDVVASTADVLVFDAMAWRPRMRSWVLTPDVAEALGELTRSGVTHGDFAPWNLLRTAAGWSVIDWEAVREVGEPWSDLWHYVVQAHALIGQPRRQTILDGLAGKGWIGEALTAYASSSGAPVDGAAAALEAQLHRSLLAGSEGGRRPTQARRRRARLLAAVGRS